MSSVRYAGGAAVFWRGQLDIPMSDNHLAGSILSGADAHANLP